MEKSACAAFYLLNIVSLPLRVNDEATRRNSLREHFASSSFSISVL
jgi:hypothetical protein